MRKMKKHRFIVITCYILLSTFNHAKAQENFEDADNLGDLTSGNTGQQFDLRHTIPGEPDVDYPIYSAVPKTSFECTGRHEGYYADIESRCQAFRICTHTARSVSGFGFLCPNGTLFSQKYFVCDWYRNVNCDDSERYYSKNDANRVGSSFDMIETVRKMIEYPMKTISKALQQNPGASRNPIAERQRGINRFRTPVPPLSSRTTEHSRPGQTQTPRKSAVTRDQVESVHNYGNEKAETNESSNSSGENHDAVESSQNAATVLESSSGEIESSASPNIDSSSSTLSEDVYVNSLGELSTDPGVTFDRTNAHIIAEPRRYRYEKHMNFATKVNTGLNNLADLPANENLAPDYVKAMRDNKDETTQIDLASNINGLLDEIATDLDTSQSGYQIKAPTKSKHSFRFLSRGFSSQNDPYKYKKPKQTASTVRFTPNELPIEAEKMSKKTTAKNADEAIPIEVQIITTTTPASTTESVPELEPELEPEPPSELQPEVQPAPVTEAETASELEQTTEPASAPESEPEPDTPPIDDAFNYHVPPPNSPTFEEVPYLNPPLFGDTTASEINALDVTDEPVDDETATTIFPERDEPDNLERIPTPASPTYAALYETTTTTPVEWTTIEANTASTDITENLVVEEQKVEPPNETQSTEPEDVNDQLDEERVDVNKQAANLFLSGLQLTNNENKSSTTEASYDPLLIHVPEDHSYLTAWVTSAAPPTTTMETVPATTLEPTPPETGGSLQERIRNYRRLSNLQRASAKPLVYGKRATSRMSTTATTPKTTTTTRSYLKRVAASRLRLSRLAAAAGSSSRNSNTFNVLSAPNALDTLSPDAAGANKKLTVRNIDKETANAGNGIVGDKSAAAGIVTWESVRDSLQRFQVNRNRDGNGNNDNSYSTTIAPPTSTVAAPRNSLLRMRNRFSNFKMPTSRNNAVTASSTATPLGSGASVPSTSLNILNTLSLIPPPLPSSPTQTDTSSTVAISTPSSTSTTSSSSSLLSSSVGALADNTNSNSNSAAAPSTFISFDKLTRSIVDDSILQNYRAGQILGRTSASSAAATSSSSASPSSSYQTASRNAFNQVVTSQSRSAARAPVSYTKLPALAPSQLIPPLRPAHLPLFPAPATPTVTTTPGPRIVIARAEGQRIESNSVSSIISSLISQQQQLQKQPQTKPTHSSSYMPLDDFLTKKFGNQFPTKLTPAKSAYFAQTQQQQQQPQQQQQQQRQQLFPQQQFQQIRPALVQQPQQQISNSVYQIPQSHQSQQYQQQSQSQQHQNHQLQSLITPPLPLLPLQQQQPQNNYYQQTAVQQQQSPNQLPPATPSLQPLITQGIFANYQQQQRQLPQFPPLATQPPSQQLTPPELAAEFGGGQNYQNIQLPSLANSLIPAPQTVQFAQKRSDIGIDKLTLTDSIPLRSGFTGVSSYDVPLSSIGRLPNDITDLLRRRLRSY